MLEAIILKLVTTLTGYLFSATLDSFKSIEVEGAPGWYGKNLTHENLYAYGYAQGGIESIEIARENCKIVMIKRLNEINEIVAHDNFKTIQDPKEKVLLGAFKDDPDIRIFVNKNMKYEKVEHFEKQNENLLTKARPAETFAGGMIPKKVVIEYQKERLEKIKSTLTHFRADSNFDELDSMMER